VVGTDVTISGAGLAAATAVSFGSGAANFTVVDDSHLSAVVPYDATSGPVVVTTPTADIPAPEPFTVDPPVALVQHTIAHGGSALSPSSTWLAPATGGDLLTAVFEWSGSGTPVAPPGWSLASKRNGVAIFEGRPAAPPVTVTIGGTALGAWILDITEWSGVTAAMPVDRTAFATSGAIAQTIASSGTTPTTSAAGELALGAIKSLRSVALTSPSNGFSTLDMAHQGSITLGVFYRVAGAPAPESVSVTLSAAAKWRGSIATFRRN
jgi:hypothetical protein